MMTALKLLAIGVALALTSCNTMSGIGRDLQRGGAALKQNAEAKTR